jgi:hypothetical protein
MSGVTPAFISTNNTVQQRRKLQTTSECVRPSGNFYYSCSGSLSGCAYTATCRTLSGGTKITSVTVNNDCDWACENNDGALNCLSYNCGCFPGASKVRYQDFLSYHVSCLVTCGTLKDYLCMTDWLSALRHASFMGGGKPPWQSWDAHWTTYFLLVIFAGAVA